MMLHLSRKDTYCRLKWIDDVKQNDTKSRGVNNLLDIQTVVKHRCVYILQVVNCWKMKK